MNQSEAHLHSRCMVHFHPSLSPRPSSNFSEGLVPRLSTGIKWNNPMQAGRTHSRVEPSPYYVACNGGDLFCNLIGLQTLIFLQQNLVLCNCSLTPDPPPHMRVRLWQTRWMHGSLVSFILAFIVPNSPPPLCYSKAVLVPFHTEAVVGCEGGGRTGTTGCANCMRVVTDLPCMLVVK